MKDIIYTYSKKLGYLHGQFQRRIILIIFYGNDRLSRDAEFFCQIFLPQFSVLSKFFDIILHPPPPLRSFAWFHTI